MIGLALCICGTMMVFAVFPMQHIGDGVVMTAVELHTRFFKRGVFRYLMGQLVLIGLGILLDQISDFGKKSSMLYLATCSCSEGLSVIAAKTGSIFLRDSVREWSTAHLSYFAVVVIVLAVTLPLQVVFINKAMAEFGNTEVPSGKHKERRISVILLTVSHLWFLGCSTALRSVHTLHNTRSPGGV
mmetsp:Transcript_25230/g.99573  ORF Transcript_25230/g.99573 Transcript_25230/m.99573 type:complete len:186 (-) Transcript_25230:1118-1675(-)